VKLPKERPEGCHASDRRLSGCPTKVCEPWIWAAMQSWSAWSTFRALPGPGALADQDARLLEAISIIESEASLVRAHESEKQMNRAARRRKK